MCSMGKGTRCMGREEREERSHRRLRGANGSAWAVRAYRVLGEL
jgi:hypothetical protein